MSNQTPNEFFPEDFFATDNGIEEVHQNDLLDPQKINKDLDFFRIPKSQRKTVQMAVNLWNSGNEMAAVSMLSEGPQAIDWHILTSMIFNARSVIDVITGRDREPKQKNLLSTDRKQTAQIVSKTIAEHTLLVTINVITNGPSSMIDRARRLASQCHPIDPNRPRRTRLINDTDRPYITFNQNRPVEHQMRYLTFAVTQQNNKRLDT